MKLLKYDLKTLNKDSISQLPKTWGIYFFLDSNNFPLYIGMSNNLRHRLYSHFRENNGKKRRLINQTVNIGYRLTTGFLTTALLESKLIKEFKPQFNVMLRKNRYMAVLEFGYNEAGYKFITAKREKVITKNDMIGGLGIFRNLRQAENKLQNLQIEFSLCPRLLALEKQVEGACFSYHLKKCSGACTGAIDVKSYNTLLETALEDIIVPEWKQNLVIGETIDGLEDKITLQNWTVTNHESNHLPSLVADSSFEFDNYRIIRSYMNSTEFKFKYEVEEAMIMNKKRL